LILGEVKCVEEVLLATSYDEALTLLDQNPEFIFLDIYMPGKNGIELLTYIKKNYSKPKVCMVSNSINMFTKQRWKSLGACECWDKSKEFEKIQEFIIEHTENESNGQRI
jgi:CitB family two-component system response regulator MalR